jgi:formylglycine-generating enzyme required for sulfatase activity
LVQALRQCDGGGLQCIVLVRDDFWLAVSRFMQALEVRVLEGENSRLVDLFDPRHARKVLTAFGRAFGTLPGKELNKEQEAFLDKAIAELAQDGKVISVRLALFAEMVKGRPWMPTTLKEVGGVEGIGVTFLEETFAASTAPPQHRLHQKAAQAVLRALLPEAGTDIKGHMRSQEELRAVSGYTSRLRDFEELLRILDGELRLITPTEAEEIPARSASDGPPHPLLALRAGKEGYYQLTHDYLVPSLRDWLTRKQKETRRGRAELLLADRAAVWNARPENRQLPTWWEWGNIRLFTRKRNWLPPQDRMMRRAGRYHGIRGSVLLLIIALLAFGSWWTFGLLRARFLVDALQSADTSKVPELIGELEPYRRWADPLLRAKLAQSDLEERKRLHLAMALLPVDATRSDMLRIRLLTANGPDEVMAIRGLLCRHAPSSGVFWTVVQDEKAEKPRRLRAACALALFDEADPRWERVADGVVLSLASENLLLLRDWVELLRPVMGQLVPYAARHLTYADPGRFVAYLTMLRASPEEATAALRAVLDRTLPDAANLSQHYRQARAREKAQAAAALLQLGDSERVWPLFRHSEDDTFRSYLIHSCAPLGVDPTILAHYLERDRENDATIRQGLLLALGEYARRPLGELGVYTADPLEAFWRGLYLDQILTIYGEDADPGVHSAAEWLLFSLSAVTPRLNRMVVVSRQSAFVQQFTKAVHAHQLGGLAKPGWYVNSQSQTFAVIPAPGRFWIGSPPNEKGRDGEVEDRREVRIDYAFALGTKLVTVEEFKKSVPEFQHRKEVSPAENTPINGISWYNAARYCNWLSEQEKIPKDQWCYEPNAKGEYGDGMKVKANYPTLSGYRLPREVEWEYACRAGTVTAWSHGSDESMLEHYAWNSQNSGGTMQPVGRLKPNSLGLFDMHGNAWQWCAEIGAENWKKEVEEVKDNYFRCVRGGSFDAFATGVRSSSRFWITPKGSETVPRGRTGSYGFRVARTIKP